MGGAGHWEVVAAQWRSCYSACREEATLPASNGHDRYSEDDQQPKSHLISPSNRIRHKSINCHGAG